MTIWRTAALLLMAVWGLACTSPAPAPNAPDPAPKESPAPAPVTPAPVTSAPAAPSVASVAIKLDLAAEGFTRPLGVYHAGDGSGRLFLVEQPGRILIIRDGKVMETPFLEITGKVTSRGNEQGLLGLAFHPGYRENGIFYVHYSGAGGQTVVARYRVSPASPDRADPASEEVLLTAAQPYSNHNGGTILFGPDGYLYIALGDGGSAGDPQGNAQNLNSLLGKLLRIDPGTAGAYKIPANNPFVGKAGRDEIWAYGLRNPWRIAFDRATGDLWIADVGQNKWEEINFQPAQSRGGENYGWKVYEADERYSPGDPAGPVFPVARYGREMGCSVTGGTVYRGKAVPDLVGTYLYADFCTGRVWGLRREGKGWDSAELLKTNLQITAFGEDEAGELYLVHRGGQLYRVAPGK